MGALAVTRTAARRRRRARRRPRAAPYLFLAPAGILFVLFILLPAGYAIVLSLRRTKVEGGIIGQQVESLRRARELPRRLSDPEFVESLVRLAIYALIAVPVT